MPNEINVLVQAEMTGAGLDADQERTVRLLVEDERTSKGRELTPGEAVQVVRDGLVKIMDKEAGG